MRASTLGGFGAGFACGVMVVGIAVWRRDNVKPPPADSSSAASYTLPAPIPVDRGAAPPPHAPPPPAATGAADRTMHLEMPLEGVQPSSLTQSFHDKRDGRTHEAVDIPAPHGTPVRAVAAGTVVKLFTSKQGGLTVYQFDQTQTYCFYYAHLDRYSPDIKEGMAVRPGDVLGYVGTSGNAPKDVPHLHLAVFVLGPEKKWWTGKAIDPLPLFR
jgi:peptidoglycan LD-endopeptidase LytH